MEINFVMVNIIVTVAVLAGVFVIWVINLPDEDEKRKSLENEDNRGNLK